MPIQVMTDVLSTILRVRQEDGTFIPVFPISTIDEVYYDIDRKIKLSTILKNYSKAREVESIEMMYYLSRNEVNLLDMIKITNENRYFIVVDLNNLGSELGYEELITRKDIDIPNGILQLDEYGKVKIENLYIGGSNGLVQLNGNGKIPLENLDVSGSGSLAQLDENGRIPMDVLYIGGANELARLDNKRELPIDNMPATIEFIVYSDSDITT